MEISVIVPIYNGENYLRRCLDSILCQSFTDFELLLINDGSKDSSGAICDEYATRDNRIRVFHKENGGVSSARNLGLDNMCGEWVAFCDCDDWIESDYLEKMFEKTLGVDLVLTSIIGEAENGEFIWKETINDSEDQVSQIVLKNIIGRVPHSKLFKREIIERNQIRFDTRMKLAEDTKFNLDYYNYVNALSISSACYHWLNENKEKYSMSAKDAVYHIKQLYEAYGTLGSLKRIDMSRVKIDTKAYFVGKVKAYDKKYGLGYAETMKLMAYDKEVYTDGRFNRLIRRAYDSKQYLLMKFLLRYVSPIMHKYYRLRNKR